LRRIRAIKLVVSLSGALLVAGVPARAQEAAQVLVLQSQGELNRKGEAGAVKEQQFPAGTALQAGQAPAGATAQSLSASPPTSTAALSFGRGEVVTLSTGASASRTGTAERGEYQVTGAAHLLFDFGEPPGRVVVVNGVAIRVAKAHLFYNGWVAPPRLRVVEGFVQFAAPGRPEEEALDVVSGEWILLGPGAARVQGEPGAPADDPLLAWSQLAGFEAPGPYKYVGDAYPADSKLRLNRNDELTHVTGAKIPIFEGDQVLTEDGQRVRLQFTTGDKIALTGKSVLKVDEYLPERREKPSMLFSVLGRVRAIIASRLAPDSVRLKTATATIGVKGTDFNTVAEEASTLVETVDGQVGVSNYLEEAEVVLGPGTQTSVSLGENPAPPSPIPPERLQELQQEAAAAGLVAAAAAAVPAPAVPPPPVAAPPPPPPPAPPAAPPPAAAAPPPAPAPAPAAPARTPCDRIQRAYEDSIAARSGAAQDDAYITLRGSFGCADLPRSGGE
jgi:hypothetical protein